MCPLTHSRHTCKPSSVSVSILLHPLFTLSNMAFGTLPLFSCVSGDHRIPLRYSMVKHRLGPEFGWGIGKAVPVVTPRFCFQWGGFNAQHWDSFIAECLACVLINRRQRLFSQFSFSRISLALSRSSFFSQFSFTAIWQRRSSQTFTSFPNCRSSDSHSITATVPSYGSAVRRKGLSILSLAITSCSILTFSSLSTLTFSMWVKLTLIFGFTSAYIIQREFPFPHRGLRKSQYEKANKC